VSLHNWWIGFRDWWTRDISTERDDRHGAVGQAPVLEAERERRIEAGVHNPDAPVGLALSGGGIRSATFALGVLQSLAGARKLASFDYLSTVSGGGYIGAWLSAWVHRSSLATVEGELARSATSLDQAANPEPAELQWLRSYSNYLAPKLGLLRLDSLTLIAIWFRNTFLNLIVFAAALAMLLMLPRMLLPWAEAGAKAGAKASAVCGDLAAVLGIVTLAGIAYNLEAARRSPAVTPASGRYWGWLYTPQGVACTVLAPATGAILLAACWLLGSPELPAGPYALARFGVITAIVVGGLWFLIEWKFVGESPRRLWWPLVVYAIALAVGTVVAGGGLMIVRILWDPIHRQPEVGVEHVIEALTLGPVAVFAVAVVSTSVFAGLVGREYFERSREWWARLNAWLTTEALVWLAVCVLSFYAWPIVEFIVHKAPTWLSTLGAASWFGSIVTALFLRPEKGASDRAVFWRSVIANVAAWIVVLGLLLATAFAISRAFVAVAGVEVKPVKPMTTPSSLSLQISKEATRVEANVALEEVTPIPFSAYTKARLENLAEAVRKPKTSGPITNDYTFAALITCLAILLLFGWRVDVNKFSLHNLYKNRLVRCYLGASNRRRAQQPFTGLDDTDDLRLQDLAGPTAEHQRQRPYHLVNTALNITQGRRLAWQERKAASFVFAPSHCGFALSRTQGEAAGLEAFQPTARFGKDDAEEPGISLGSAFTTSGAALSANRGYSTDPAIAALLTLFNVRLGRWTANPRGDRHHRPSPRFGLLCYLQELFGFSNEERSYVYLSDGGHFDNLGIYELVRRRCRLILVVDATADAQRKFDDLGMAIRKCRIDFGVEIRMALDELRPRKSDGLTQQNWAIGKIYYPSADGKEAFEADLLYLKPTLCTERMEPRDILAYAAQNPDFPHQTTVDQCFGEEQFESYRRLGYFTGECCLAEADDLIPDPPSNWNAPVNLVPAEAAADTVAVAASSSAEPVQSGSPPRWRRVLMLLAATLFALALLDWLNDRWMGAIVGNVCPTLSLVGAGVQEPYVTSAMRLLGANNPVRAQTWLWFDNTFIVLYLATFIMAAIAAGRGIFGGRLSRLRMLAITVAIGLAVLAALADYAENFHLLNGLGSAPDALCATALQAALATNLKWRFVVLAAVATLGLVIWALVPKRPVKKRFTGIA
jgi:hypothetical protein